jgi:UDP-2,4-diacetamido-2,4,6-trideoxy-beta-L-altropyranose hydrolase
MKVFIITEGNAQTGYGHLTRCLAVYQGFEVQSITPVLVANCDDNGRKVLGDISLEVFDWVHETDKLIELIIDADIAMIDSYLAPLSVYERIKKAVDKTVFFDDNLRLNYPPGTIINGAVNAGSLPYTHDDIHIYLLGLDYTPMRKAFWDIPERPQKELFEDLLITIGGVDTTGITFNVLDAVVAEYPSLNYHVVIGDNNYAEKLKEYSEFNNIKFYYSIDEYEMMKLMHRCDMAISAAGQTSYELYRMSIPMVLVKIAENQKHNIDGFFELQVIRDVIDYQDEGLYEKIKLSIKYPNYYTVKPESFGSGAINIVERLIP